MLYNYDLTPVEVDTKLVEEVGEEIIGWGTYDTDDLSDLFEYDAEERIEEHIRNLDDLQGVYEDQIDTLVDEALEVDVPEVALELARDFVDELTHYLEITKERIEDNINILENI